MAGELVSFGIKKLWDLLSQESERFQGVEDQVTGLKRDLNLLGSFLKDADAKKHTTAVVRNCVEEIQEIVFDAEDIIETYLLKESLGKTSGIKKSIKRLAFIIPDRRRYALDIGGIRMRISDVIRDMQSFGVQQAIADGGYMQPHGDRQREMRQTFSKDYESDFVGLDANVKKLVGYLVEEENVQVVSITGMGGLGKTTLARQVFNHEDVKHQFERLAWVCVSQEFTRRSVWQTILQNLTSKERKDEILNMNEAELQDELFRLLETSKSLIVFDDIWKEEDWDLIKRIFPPNKDWKVLLTSRNESVAQGDIAYINFKPECLNIQDSWTLFQRIAMPRKDAPEFKVTDEMEEMAKEMIKHCGGLPLAVKVLGGLLAAKYTLHDWKRLSENIGSHVVIGRTSGNNGSIDHVLSLSFEELPSNLKHCFLYLAIFQEDHMINVSKLSYYWAAEGISEARRYDGETIRDVGDSNVEELVRRNMVISKRDDVTLRFETCHLHDMMREICLLKAKEENFLQIVGASSSSTAYSNSGTSRRLALHNPTTTSHFDRHIKNLKLRSLVIFWNEFRKEWKLSWLTLTRLQLIRVLDLSRVEFEGKKVPCSLGKLIHLRYLSLEKVVISHLPYSLRNLKLLIYLNLGVYGSSLLYVPNFLKELRELKYLKLPMFMSDKTKLELSNLEKLETLKNFSTGKSSVDDLRGMARLRILSIRLKDETDLETLSASISGLKRLEGLSIIDDIRPERRIKEGMVLDFIHLKKLKLHIKLPRQQHFHSHLTSISLSHCFLEEDPMPILEKLLQLKKVSLVYKSFIGRRMVCSSGGFPQLQILAIVQLAELDEWIVEEGAMPLLHDLVLVFCDILKEVPDGLRFIYSLEALTMGMKWKERLSEGGDDYYKVQHIPFVDFLGHQEIQ